MASGSNRFEPLSPEAKLGLKTQTLSLSHLRSKLRAYTEHYNGHRWHWALGIQSPARRDRLRAVGKESPDVARGDALGGLI
jgi:hypothetical protein